MKKETLLLLPLPPTPRRQQHLMTKRLPPRQQHLLMTKSGTWNRLAKLDSGRAPATRSVLWNACCLRVPQDLTPRYKTRRSLTRYWQRFCIVESSRCVVGSSTECHLLLGDYCTERSIL